MKTIYVIAMTLRHFINSIPEKFGRENVTAYSSGVVISNGVRYKFVSGKNQLRGIHNAQIEFWGPVPMWAVEAEAEIEHARRP